jgi:hypothetical protein
LSWTDQALVISPWIGSLATLDLLDITRNRWRLVGSKSRLVLTNFGQLAIPRHTENTSLLQLADLHGL